MIAIEGYMHSTAKGLFQNGSEILQNHHKSTPTMKHICILVIVPLHDSNVSIVSSFEWKKKFGRKCPCKKINIDIV